MILSHDVVFMEDQTIEHFGKGKVPQDASQEGKEHEGESFALARAEEVDNDDFPVILPRDDNSEDEIINEVVDEVGVAEGEHNQVSHD